MFSMKSFMTVDKPRGEETKEIVVLPPANGVKMGVWYSEEKIEKKLSGLHWREEKKTVNVFK